LQQPAAVQSQLMQLQELSWSMTIHLEVAGTYKVKSVSELKSNNAAKIP
jgi:hypothetical protein